MRRFPEPQHFFAAAWQNWDLRSFKEGPRHTLFKHFLSYFQNIGLVELFMIDFYGLQHLCRNLEASNFGSTKPTFWKYERKCLNKVCLGLSLQFEDIVSDSEISSQKLKHSSRQWNIVTCNEILSKRDILSQIVEYCHI